MLTEEVKQAIVALQAEFDGAVSVVETGDGGAHVTVAHVPLGPPYAQDESWFAFTISFLHPYGDIYPMFVRPDLSRLDGQLLNTPINPNNNFQGQPAVMISRRSRSCGPDKAVDPVLKLLKVREWMLSQ